MKRKPEEKGFTLIEIIVVLIILGIAAIALANIITYVMQGYTFARNADQLSQKAQLAMSRIKIELTDVTAVSVATADQVDYTLPRSSVPSCTVDTGCQYSIKRTGTSITMEGTNPVITAQTLIDGLTVNNNGNNFLSFYQSDGATAWTNTSAISDLAKIQIIISLDNETGKGVTSLKYEGSVNPRANTMLNAPKPN